MIKNNVLFMLLCILSAITHAQEITPEQLGFIESKLTTKELGEVNYFITQSDNSDKKLPLLVYLDGSGAFPLFQQVEQGIASTLVINYQQLKQNYRIVLISKPGVPFIDTVGRNANGFPTYDSPKEYIEKISLKWRVESANLIIQDIINKHDIDTSKIVVFGFSEGAQVAPAVAANNKAITHLLLFSGNGLNQLFDPIVNARMKSQRGQISEQSAQKEIDSLFEQYKDIYKNPNSTNKTWWGHTYKRWSSFANTSPLESLVDLDIPIYLANGSLDENSVLSADYLNLEFIKKGKTNLTYKTYSGYDHQFNQLIFEDGQFKQAIPQLTNVLKDGFKWLNLIIMKSKI